jgi:hypothetical protein
MTRKAPKVRREPARGFYEVTRGRETVYVKRGYRLIQCTGDAHSNAHIDGCMQCLDGIWGWMLAKARPTGDRDVTIEVREVGDSFGHCGVVRRADSRRPLHETEVVPFGARGAAATLAREWAESRGYAIVEPDEAP